MTDFTELILTNSIWFVSGALIYYVLTFSKVHLIWRIQERVWNPTFEKNIFENRKKDFFVSFFTKSAVHKGTINYLFSYSVEKFRVFEHRFTSQLNRKLIFLNAYTFFLKPFLICAIALLLIKCWIASEFWYDEMRITLGEIQKLTDRLNSYSLVKSLQDYKPHLFLFFAVLLVFVPNYIIKKSTKGIVKNRIFLALNIVLITLNVSFFGALASDNAQRKSDQLIDLKDQICSIHYDVARDVFAEIVLIELEPELTKESNFRLKEYRRFKEKSEKKTQEFNKEINDDLKDSLLSKLSSLSRMIIHFDEFQVKTKKITLKNNPQKNSPSNFFEENLKKTKAKNKGNHYFYNPDDWNYEKGKEQQRFCTDLVQNKPTNKFRKNLRDVLKLVFTFGVEVAVNSVFNTNEIGFESQKTLKKVASILADNQLQEPIFKKLMNVLGFGDNLEKASAQLYKKDLNYTVEDMTKYQSKNDKFYRTQVKNAQIRQAIIDKEKAISWFNKRIAELVDKEVFKINNKAIRDNLIRTNKEKSIELAKNDYNKTAASLFMSQYKLESMKSKEIYNLGKTLDFSGKFKSNIIRSIAYHPFTENACPICNYLTLTDLFNH